VSGFISEQIINFVSLITDLSFDGNGKVSTGRELIEAARELQPGLTILVFSAENANNQTLIR
jgi:hypothetical protein